MSDPSRPPADSAAAAAASRARSAAAPPRPVAAPASAGTAVDRADTAATPKVSSHGESGMAMGKASTVAGADGGLHITVQKFWVPVGNDLPAGYDVATLPGHGLEVTLTQLAYSKTYSGTGSLKTGLTPVAPIGTAGMLFVRDLVTGETLEQPWTWHLVGGGGVTGSFWAGLVSALKRAVWKG
jgi:hypothetical protein